MRLLLFTNLPFAIAVAAFAPSIPSNTAEDDQIDIHFNEIKTN